MNNHTQVTIDQPTSTTELMMNHEAMNNMYRLAETMAGGKATVPHHLTVSGPLPQNKLKIKGIQNE